MIRLIDKSMMQLTYIEGTWKHPRYHGTAPRPAPLAADEVLARGSNTDRAGFPLLRYTNCDKTAVGAHVEMVLTGHDLGFSSRRDYPTDAVFDVWQMAEDIDPTAMAGQFLLGRRQKRVFESDRFSRTARCA